MTLEKFDYIDYHGNQRHICIQNYPTGRSMLHRSNKGRKNMNHHLKNVSVVTKYDETVVLTFANMVEINILLYTKQERKGIITLCCDL